MALLNETPRSATVLVTMQPTALLCLYKNDLYEIMLMYPSMAISLNKILAKRIEEMNFQRGLDFVFLSRLKLDPSVLSLVPEQIITNHNVLPIAYSRNTLTLAMVNPNNLLAIDEVRKFVRGIAIEPAVWPRKTSKGLWRMNIQSYRKGIERKTAWQAAFLTALIPFRQTF